jgi:hypothetical protein
MITDKMIEDIVWMADESSNMDKAYSMEKTKELLKEKGYEVEEKKSKLDEAREFYKDMEVVAPHILNLKNKYEEAIKEIQIEKEKYEYIKSKWSMIVDLFQGNEKLCNILNISLGEDIIDGIVTYFTKLQDQEQQKPTVNFISIAWLKSIATENLADKNLICPNDISQANNR